ncbi:MAG: fused MFS/spermidine synthase [bacterium JZ-2024 1]
MTFCAGAAVLIFQIVGIRMLQATFGSSIQVITMVITTFLGSLTLGYFVGGAVADARPSFRVFSGVPLAAGLLILVTPYYARPLSEYVADHHIGGAIAPLYIALALFLLPTAILGMTSPFAIRLLARDPSTTGRLAGRIFGISTIGSILGGLSVPVLISFFAISQILMGTGVVLACLSMLLILSSPGSVKPLAHKRI